jgi:hydrogenase nickel incorporation protein HypA/HybF
VHELALADAIVTIAAEHAGDRRVARVELEVGALRQVVPDALAFAFELVAQGTAVEGAELVVDDVPVRLGCRRCGSETDGDELPLACGVCGSLDVEVRQGEEFQVVALELEEVATVGSK